MIHLDATAARTTSRSRLSKASQPARALCRPPQCEAGGGRHTARAVRCLDDAGRTAVRDVEGRDEDARISWCARKARRARCPRWSTRTAGSAMRRRRPTSSTSPIARASRAVLGRGGQRVRARQHPRRRRIRPALASDAACARTGRRRMTIFIAVGDDLIRTRHQCQAQDRGIEAGRTAACWSASRWTQRPDLYGAIVMRVAAARHAALLASVGGRIVDRRIWRPGQARGLGVHLAILALSKSEARRAISRHRSSTPRPKTTASTPATRANSPRGWKRMAIRSSTTRTPKAATRRAPTRSRTPSAPRSSPSI